MIGKTIYIIVSMLIALSFISPLYAQDTPVNQDNSGKETEYIEFEKRFDDRAGKLTEDELKTIEETATTQEQEIGLKAFLLIMSDIPSWDFDEFAKRQFLYWKSNGIVDDKSYLILIILDNRKFQIVRGDYIVEREASQDILNLRNHLWLNFENNNYAVGITEYIEGLGEIPSLKNAMKEEKIKKDKSSWFTVIGILILIIVLTRMNYKNRMRAMKEEEERRRKETFIE